MRAKVSVTVVSQDGVIAEKTEAACLQGNGLSTAWGRGEIAPLPVEMVGPYMLPYDVSEHCCLSLHAQTAAERFVSVRLGPLLANDTICKAGSMKFASEWHDCLLEFVIEDLPLKQMAYQSPIGVVAWRCKIWAQARVSRRWVGRTLPICLPTQPHNISVGGLEVVVALKRGAIVDDAISRGAKLISYGAQLDETPAPKPAIDDFFGKEVLRATGEKQWGVAVALLRELTFAPVDQQHQAMKRADQTKRTSLRLCVDGQWMESPSPLQVLEGGTLTVILGVRRPYFWVLKVTAVCGRSLSFLGEIRIGMPRSRSNSHNRPWTARPGNVSLPRSNDCQWSDPKACAGRLEMMPSASSHVGRMRLEEAEADLAMCLAQPGEQALLGTSSFRNPLLVAMLGVQGSIVGVPAAGIFDVPTCARLAAELGACKPGRGVGPREAAAATLVCGAWPNALADDGLSPYTAALLTEDPCGLLSGLDPSIRERIRRGNDAAAWAEVGRSSAGAGRIDLVATPLSRGLAVPEDLAEGLLTYCFHADLPLLAMRALGRVNGQQHLLPALERAEDPQWLRVVERILRQSRVGSVPSALALIGAPQSVATSSSSPMPPGGRLCDTGSSWFSTEMLAYALRQSRLGRHQFRLLLHAFLERLRSTEEDFFQSPAVLVGGGAECSICFEPLCQNVPVAFVESGRSICPHFLCATCARGCAATAAGGDVLLRCPECRREGSGVAAMPQLAEDPISWFDFLATPSGVLHRTTLIRAVSAMLPVDADQLTNALNNGVLSSSPVGEEVTAAEFLSNGLYAWVRRHEEEHRRWLIGGRKPIVSDRSEWFKHWDVSNRGVLTCGDILRGILRKFEVSSLENHRVDELRRRISRVWDRYIAERKRKLGHCNTEGVTSSEFFEAGGLGELLEEEFDLALSREESRSTDGSTPWLSAVSHYPQHQQPRRKRRIVAVRPRIVAVHPAPPAPHMARTPAVSLTPRRRSFSSGRAVVPEDVEEVTTTAADTTRTPGTVMAVRPDEAPDPPSDSGSSSSSESDVEDDVGQEPGIGIVGPRSGTCFDLVLFRNLTQQERSELLEGLLDREDTHRDTEISSDWTVPGLDIAGHQENTDLNEMLGLNIPRISTPGNMMSPRSSDEPLPLEADDWSTIASI